MNGGSVRVMNGGQGTCGLCKVLQRVQSTTEILLQSRRYGGGQIRQKFKHPSHSVVQSITEILLQNRWHRARQKWKPMLLSTEWTHELSPDLGLSNTLIGNTLIESFVDSYRFWPTTVFESTQFFLFKKICTTLNNRVVTSDRFSFFPIHAHGGASEEQPGKRGEGS